MARAEAPRPPVAGGTAWKPLAACGAATLAAAAWLLAPLHGPPAPPALRTVLVDASASVTRLRPSWEGWARARLTDEARSAAEAGEELLVIAYARDVVALAGPGRVAPAGIAAVPLGLSPEGSLGSDLAAALALVEPLLEGRRPTALRLLSDRGSTGRDPEAALRRIEARGAAREWIAPPPIELPDLALARLDLPPEVEPGAPLGARAWIEARAPQGAGPLPFEIEVELRTPSGTRRWSLEGQADPGQAAASVSIDLGAAERGTSEVLLRAVLTGGPARGDAIPENDRRGGSVRAGEALRVRVVAGGDAREAAARWVASLRERPGIDAVQVEPAAVGATLADADVLVSYDAALDRLPAAAVASFVRSGGGWLALVGTRTLATWQPAGELVDLAPLEPYAGDDGERDVVLLLDASGSMAGPPVDEARRAARALAAAAPRGERVVLRWFTAGLEPEVEVSADPAAVLAAREPGGGTDVLAALGDLADHYGAAAGRKALALLVTDGRDQRADDAELTSMRSRLRAAGVELAVFAVGTSADEAFLERLAGADRALRRARDPGRLEELFQREVTAARLRTQGPYAVSFTAAARGEPARDAASPEALGLEQLPSADGYVRARARSGASVAWVAYQGEPLCGLDRRGLGSVALFASLPGQAAQGWAPDWTAAHLDPLLRWLGRSRPVRRPRLVWEDGVLAVEDTPETWPAELLARADGLEARLLPGSSPLTDPRDRRAGAWPGPAPRGQEVTLLEGPGPAAGVLATLVLPPGPPEELARPERRAALRAAGPLSGAAGGAAEEALRGGHPAGPGVLALGMLLVAAAGLARGRGGGRVKGSGSAPDSQPW